MGRVLLGVTGGIAAYKACELTRLLVRAGHEVTPVLTPEAERFVEFVKGARKASPDAEILMPGEMEERTRQRRMKEGIELDDKTWSQILTTCQTLNVSPEIQ